MTITRRSFLAGVAAWPVVVRSAPRLNPAEDYSLSPSAAAWLEIDRDAFASNIRAVRKVIGTETELCAVMKADAYGHGIGLLIPAIVAENVRLVGITSNDEARVARHQGFRGRLLRLMTAPAPEMADAVSIDIEELVGNLAVARQYDDIARQHKKVIKVHLALNSAGMSRNGLELVTAQGKAALEEILSLKHLQVVGIMTHYPVNELYDMRGSLARFNEDVAWLFKHSKLQRQQVTLHTANSFATMALPETRLDMVRTGGALYGDVDTVPDASALRPVMALKTRIAAVSAYPQGNSVTYGRTAVLKRDSLLANLPIGYSDGYDRRFSNRAQVLIRGQRAPVIGRVTMNTTMVDVTDIPGVSAGDEVVLLGSQGSERIGQQELEKIIDNIFVTESTLWGNSLPKVLKSSN